MDLSLRHTAEGRSSASAAAESWFLERGLPFVLTRRARWRRLWPRTAPLLAAYATIDGCSLLLYVIVGDRQVRIEGEPTTVEWIVLTIIALAVPLAAVVGWLVSRLPSSRTRAVAATVAVTVAAAIDIFMGGLSSWSRWSSSWPRR